MDSVKVNRLDELFEKAVLEQANGKESIELKILYSQFSDEDRENGQQKPAPSLKGRVVHISR